MGIADYIILSLIIILWLALVYYYFSHIHGSSCKGCHSKRKCRLISKNLKKCHDNFKIE